MASKLGGMGTHVLLLPIGTKGVEMEVPGPVPASSRPMRRGSDTMCALTYRRHGKREWQAVDYKRV